jgi:F-type H+-transporting ATPase subunit delta
MKPTCNVKDVAIALVSAAKGRDGVRTMVRDVMDAADAFLAHPDLAVELQEPAVSAEKRRNALRAALEGSVHSDVVNALLILQESNALQVLPSFTEAVRAAAERMAGHHVADITVRAPLTKHEASDLETALRKRFGGTVDLRENVDEGVIGGMVVQVGAWRYDASVRGSLERLKHHLYV